MSRATTAVLASVLVAAAVLQSHLLPLCLLTLLGAVAGFLVATQMKDPRDLLRVPVMVAVTVLVLVGVGQLGAIGILLGVGLLVSATPTDPSGPPADASRPPARGTSRR
ncbi:hypothetical protein ABLE68_01590 [Nocardioides sp. CN2-186]|uniref:hypothetical protein n=1 Tax=Nocardioides tweenelious TaxID=3156607 RepID=UPI0032B49626